MTPLQKSILNAVKRRPMTLRELQNNLQVGIAQTAREATQAGVTTSLGPGPWWKGDLVGRLQTKNPSVPYALRLVLAEMEKLTKHCSMTPVDTLMPAMPPV